MQDLLALQRRRLVGTIMRHLETEVYPHLEPAARQAVRQKVLQAVSAYHDVVLDVLGATSKGEEIQNRLVEVLEGVERHLQLPGRR
jgi:predicted dinucleotide-utilizing enzyme